MVVSLFGKTLECLSLSPYAVIGRSQVCNIYESLSKVFLPQLQSIYLKKYLNHFRIVIDFLKLIQQCVIVKKIMQDKQALPKSYNKNMMKKRINTNKKTNMYNQTKQNKIVGISRNK